MAPPKPRGHFKRPALLLSTTVIVLFLIVMTWTNGFSHAQFTNCQFYYWDLEKLWGSADDFGENNCPRRTNNKASDDPKFPNITIDWIPSPPYLIDEGSDTPGGIFPGTPINFVLLCIIRPTYSDTF